MKKIFNTLATVLISVNLFAQSPQRLSYQAVIRNSSNQLVQSTNLGMQVSILKDSATGNSVYVERHFPKSNSNGLVTLEIGGGTVISGVFNNINWSTGIYYIKTETDLNGGANYTISGISQLLSVPYAKYADKAGNNFSGNYTDLTNKPDLSLYLLSSSTNKWDKDSTNDVTVSSPTAGDMLFYNGSSWSKIPKGTTGQYLNMDVSGQPVWKSYTINHYIGELYGGGIVFWVDNSGQHGLIASLADISISATWSNVTNAFIGATAHSTWDGLSNSTAITGQASHTSSAAKLCFDYSSGGFDDWYLPSTYELNLLYNAGFIINKTLGSNGIPQVRYWSSAEFSISNSCAIDFNGGMITNELKSDAYRVRAIRAF